MVLHKSEDRHDYSPTSFAWTYAIECLEHVRSLRVLVRPVSTLETRNQVVGGGCSSSGACRRIEEGPVGEVNFRLENDSSAVPHALVHRLFPPEGSQWAVRTPRIEVSKPHAHVTVSEADNRAFLRIFLGPQSSEVASPQDTSNFGHYIGRRLHFPGHCSSSDRSSTINGSSSSLEASFMQECLPPAATCDNVSPSPSPLPSQCLTVPLPSLLWTPPCTPTSQASFLLHH